MRRDAVHFHGTIPIFGRDKYLVFVADMHSGKRGLPADYQFTDTETCRKRLTVSRIENGSIYKFAGIIHKHYAVQRRALVAGSSFNLPQDDSAFEHFHAFLLRLGFEEFFIRDLVLSRFIRFLAHILLFLSPLWGVSTYKNIKYT